MGPSIKTVKRLWAVSQNQCAFPECSNPLSLDPNTVLGEVCHIKAQRPGGPRYDPNQTDEERHSFENLILLCALHSKVIDSEPKKYTVERLHQMKAAQHTAATPDILPTDAKKVELLLEKYQVSNLTAGGHVMIGSHNSVQGTNVVVNNLRKSIKMVPPVGSIASSLAHRNYVKHLIDRYQHFAKQQPGRRFQYGAIHGNIKRHYGAKWDLVALNRFNDLVSFLQQHVDGTKLGSINRGKGIANYSDFSRYQEKYGIRP